MGGVLSLFRKSRKMLILGPRGAGKTTVLEQIVALHKPKPSVSINRYFNFLKFKNYNIWDLKGEGDQTVSWSYYYDNTACIIFVYDSENPEQSEKLLKELCFTKELRNAVLLIVVNKMRNETGQLEGIAQIVKRRVFYPLLVAKDQKPFDIRQGFEWLLKNS